MKISFSFGSSKILSNALLELLFKYSVLFIKIILHLLLNDDLFIKSKDFLIWSMPICFFPSSESIE